MSFSLKLCEYAAYAMYHSHKRNVIDDVAQVIKRHLGKDLKFPLSGEYTLLGEQTVEPPAWKKRYKMVVYLGTEQCRNGQNYLPHWRHLMEICKKKHRNLGFVFIAHADDYKHFESELCYANIFYPMLYDYHNEFQIDNHIPNDCDFHACMLDETNTIMFVGSPIRNSKMWEEYENVMTFNDLMLKNRKAAAKKAKDGKKNLDIKTGS